MVEEIRVMWCDALEELLQCPVCLDTAQGVKVQCTNGHHICNQCRIQLQICPICKCSFIVTRNLVAEQLSAKLQEIKLSLLHPYHALNRRILHNKVCVATQTEAVCIPSTSSACQTESVNPSRSLILKNEQQLQQQRPMINLAPRVGKGVFPCRIGSCTVELPHGRIIGHIRYHHKDVFYEFSTKGTVFKKKWDLEYIINRDYDYAFHIKEMGLFFLKVAVNHKGGLIAYIQIVNCMTVSKQFVYTFEATGSYNASYTGPVKSCRVRTESVSDCLHIHENDMRQNIIDDQNVFHCNLTIKRRIDYSRELSHDRPIAAKDDIVELFDDI
ncbi:putative E3 ubiquitin-protein ligase sinah [Formica fusca]